MKKMQKYLHQGKIGVRITILLTTIILLVGCTLQTSLTPYPQIDCPLQEECPDCPLAECPQTECPQTDCPQTDVSISNHAELPYYETLWETSAHAPVVTCNACHNEISASSTTLSLSSGIKVNDLGTATSCVDCHQGDTTTATLDKAIAATGLNENDAPIPELVFIDIGNTAAAATQLGTWGMAGYQYPDKSYDAKFTHVKGYNTCIDCHDAHTLELQLHGCRKCHQGVDALDDLERVRSEISFRDYDGDHNTQEGIQREIWDLQAILYQAIQVYASQSGTAIAYQEQVAPYFFIDNDTNGEVNESELDADNAFNTWTGRLLKAAYNYHFSIQDSGAFIHNPKYILQLLYDSIEDLDAELADGLVRDDAGHFAGSGVAWRYWDADGEVDRDCARCHSANGLPTYLTTGRNYRSEPLTNDMLCTTCHPDQNMPYRYPAGAVTFPSEATLSIDSDNNLCMNCHKGRAAAISIDEITDGLDPDSISDGLKLPDIHGYPAGATLFGSQAAGAYQYKGKRYAGRNLHVEEFDDCLNCHGEHRLDIDEEQCATCHGHRASEERTKPQHHPSPMRCRDCHGMVDVEKIRGHKDYTVPEDHDGDGDILEGISQEVATLHATLYTAIQTYANDVAGTPIIYYATAPYFFIDTNGDGQSDPIEIIPDNRYRTWTPRLLQAAYNYLYSAKDPAAYAHNGDYILQILYDSLVDIDGDTRGMVRP